MEINDQQFNRSIHHIPNVADSITQKYPRLSGYDWQIIRGDQRNNPSGGHLEFYSPKETYNPIPGKPTIAVFDPSLSPEQTGQMVFGDMLHHLSDADPEWRKLRKQYSDTISSEQKQREYEYEVANFGETRDIDKWWDVSRLDAHVRGYVAGQWPKDDGFYSSEQKQILRNMEKLLKRPKQEPPKRKR